MNLTVTVSNNAYSSVMGGIANHVMLYPLVTAKVLLQFIDLVFARAYSDLTGQRIQPVACDIGKGIM